MNKSSPVLRMRGKDYITPLTHRKMSLGSVLCGNMDIVTETKKAMMLGMGGGGR